MLTATQREEELEPAAMQLESTAAAPPPSDAIASSSSSESPSAQVTVSNLTTDDEAAAAASAGSNRNLKGRHSESAAEPADAAAQLSALHAAASAANPQLAPVSEEPAAVEPASKHLKPTPPAPLTTHILSSPMLRLLGRDRGARQSLLEMLNGTELLRLLGSSRSWLSLIRESNFVTSAALRETSLSCFSQCHWLHRSVHRVQFTTACWMNSLCVRLFAGLSQCGRLRSLNITVSRFATCCPQLGAGLASLASSLQHLSFSVCSTQRAFLVEVLAGVGGLRQLRTLVLDAKGRGIGGGISSHHWNLAPLTMLPHLERFSGSKSDPCSQDQVESLSQCLQLTHLDFGAWAASRTGGLEEFAQLTCQRKELRAAPFRRLNLGDNPVIEAEGWQLLSQCSELECIDARWSSTLTASDWSQLAWFQHLQPLTIGGVNEIDLSPTLVARTQCRALLSLSIQGVLNPRCGVLWLALRTEYIALLARLPGLQRFKAEHAQPESLAPLSSSPQLTELSWIRCAGLLGENIHLRSMLPPMPLLHIHELCMETGSETSEPLNRALLVRMPRLKRGKINDIEAGLRQTSD